MRLEGVTQLLLTRSRCYSRVRAEIEMSHVTLGIPARLLCMRRLLLERPNKQRTAVLSGLETQGMVTTVQGQLVVELKIFVRPGVVQLGSQHSTTLTRVFRSTF